MKPTETAIREGTVYLTATEVARRMRFPGERGVRKVNAMANAGLLPCYRPSPRKRLFHWPSIVKANGGAA